MANDNAQWQMVIEKGAGHELIHSNNCAGKIY